MKTIKKEMERKSKLFIAMLLAVVMIWGLMPIPVLTVSAAPTTYTVSFDGNGASGNMSSVSGVSGEYTLPENNWPLNGFFTPLNKYFKGWLVDDSTVKAPGEKIIVTSDITLKAVWEDSHYGLKVGGVEVTYLNVSGITGTNISGTVTYDPATKTLTLNNATIYSEFLGGTMTSAIDADSSLTIHLIGDNTIYGDPFGESATSSHRYVVSGDEDLTFKGEGNLIVNGSEGGSFSYAIYAKNITVESDCTITSVSGTSDFLMSALNFGETFQANGSTVLASTSKTGSPLVAYNGEERFSYKYVKILPAYNITVSFDKGEGTGTMESKTVVCSREYTLPENAFTAPEGKQFKAWNVNGTEKAPGDKVALVENTTITAIWENPPHICDIKLVDRVNPDCTKGGKEAYYKCDDCGKFYEDANGITEITNLATWGNLSKLEHNYTEKIEDEAHLVAGTGANCQSAKAYYYDCIDCAEIGTTSWTSTIMGNHEFNMSEWGYKDKAAGHAHQCKYCNEHDVVLPHTPGDLATEDKDQICTTCFTVLEPATGHIHKNHLTYVTAQGASCRVNGNKAYYECSCGKYFEDASATAEIIDKNSVIILAAHNYETQYGYKDAEGHADICSCGAKNTVIPHTPNREAATEKESVKCSACGYVITPALGHIHKNNLTKVNAKEASCIVNGNKEYYICSCGKMFEDASAAVEITDKDSVVIKAAHNYSTDWKSDEKNHWNECSCGSKINSGAHKDENKDGKCDVCAYNVGLPSNSDSPVTGDNGMIWLWSAMFFIGGGLLWGTRLGKKRNIRIKM